MLDESTPPVLQRTQPFIESFQEKRRNSRNKAKRSSKKVCLARLVKKEESETTVGDCGVCKLPKLNLPVPELNNATAFFSQ